MQQRICQKYLDKTKGSGTKGPTTKGPETKSPGTKGRKSEYFSIYSSLSLQPVQGIEPGPPKWFANA